MGRCGPSCVPTRRASGSGLGTLPRPFGGPRCNRFYWQKSTRPTCCWAKYARAWWKRSMAWRCRLPTAARCAGLSWSEPTAFIRPFVSTCFRVCGPAARGIWYGEACRTFTSMHTLSRPFGRLGWAGCGLAFPKSKMGWSIGLRRCRVRLAASGPGYWRGCRQLFGALPIPCRPFWRRPMSRPSSKTKSWISTRCRIGTGAASA